MITDQAEILEECRRFYINLYKKVKTVNPWNFPQFLDSDKIPKLDDVKKAVCENDLTENELWNTLKSFKKNKSPGLDGITAEFYVAFWSLLKDKLKDVYEEAYNSRILPECLRTGVIVLLEKKGKCRTDLANWRPITLLGIDYKLLTKTLANRLKRVLPDLVHPDQNVFVPGGNIVYSAHTIRDILFHCSKEKLDLVLLAIDYTKAFDSVDFEFIFNAFEVFNFGERFKTWIRILFNGGKSCISNNGFLSETFSIERSTRQGDPISPFIFILILELLFIHIRNDNTIKGIKVLNNEIKLTSFADDATYFLKNRISVERLLIVIEQFSMVSGLEINRTKSECLLLDFEMNLDIHENDYLFGIPVVDNLKILGHYYGKSQMVCDFNHFYSKLNKMDEIVSMWKMRSLTIMGRNTLLKALINSLFMFNAQIEFPPKEFIKIIETKNKQFLWDGGIAKIAHHSLIGDFDQGGIRYKDVDSLIKAINFKFISRMKTNNNDFNSTSLPRFWIMNMFQIPPNEANHFFREHLNLLDCKFSLPRKSRWTGHPFYLELLVTMDKMTGEYPKSFEAIQSVPIWYNKMLGTRFCPNLSSLGFNYLRDIYYFKGQNHENMTQKNVSELRKLRAKINPNLVQELDKNRDKPNIIYPFQIIRAHNCDKMLFNMTSRDVDEMLISAKI